MDNNFFSLFRARDWRQGSAENVTADSGGISIETSQRYVRKMLLTFAEIAAGGQVMAIAAGDNGMIYYADDDHRICMYDSGSHMTGILSHVSLENIEAMDYGGGKIYVCDGRILHILSCETGMLEYVIELDEAKGKLKSLHGDGSGFVYLIQADGTLRCINKSLNIDDTYHTSFAGKDILLKGYGGKYAYIYDTEAGQLFSMDFTEGTTDILSFPGITAMGIAGQDIIAIKHEKGMSALYEYIRGKGFNLKFYCEDCPDIVEFEGKSEVYLISTSKGQVVIMKKVPGISINRRNHSYTGTYYTPVLDAVNEEMIWDKVLVEAEVPEDCMFSISYFAFNDFELINEQMTFRDYIKNAGNGEADAYLEARWQGELFNFERALFRGASGRYMLLRIRLWGTGNSTPAIRKIRVYYGRNTYTRYLPEIYSSGKESFLERYLSMAEVLMLDMEERIDRISDNFDADTSPPEMLRWLCSWMDLSVDHTWSDDKVRNLIKCSPEIFSCRGTKRAIETILGIYLGVKPMIVEDYMLNEMRSTEEMRSTVNRLYGENPYGFTVLVNIGRELSYDEKIAVKKILDLESPAYCTYHFIELGPWKALDKHTYLGINSQIMDYSGLRLDNKSVLPYNAVLTKNQGSEVNYEEF